MASIQERLQVNRSLLDKWSIREQLCLASAVACSGDQNWMSVSRTLKLVCGNPKSSVSARPSDWFSQKNCAVQYGHLLEEVETPRRKKRSSESSVSCSPATVEPSTEVVLKRLTEERMQEIKVELRKEQEEYAKLYNEIKSMQSGEIDDAQLLEMWSELEKDQEKERIEEMKLENQLRERELKKQEQQRSWHTNSITQSSASSTNSLKSSTDTTAIDMDVEEIVGSGKTIIPANSTNSSQVQTGTAPLLSSLLKSPTAATPASGIIVTSASVRNTAPTITTLLTGGSIPNQNQPVLIPSHDEAVQLLTRPLSGPPLDTILNPVSVAQTLLSPSQSAPTLSMLLEKNKTTVAVNAVEAKPAEIVSSNTKLLEHTTVEDSNNESVPMDIEENITQTKIDSKANLQTDEIDETDPNEEQQLLEVFKNIGNIEELDIDVSDVIDEEVDFLKGVDEETQLDENIDIEQKLDENFTDLDGDIKLLAREAAEAANNIEEYGKNLSGEKMLNENSPEDEVQKIEIISSDDSNDNIPLAAVASLESSKDRLNTNESSNEESFLKDQVESANLKNDLDQEETANDSSDNKEMKHKLLDENEKSNQECLDADQEEKKELKVSESEEDIFLAPIAEETKIDKNSKFEKEEINNRQQIKIEAKYDNETNDSFDFPETESNEQQTTNATTLEPQSDSIDILALPKLHPPPSISIADTDENSSSTDISIQTRKDDKIACRTQRKSPHETKTDDEQQNSTKQPMATPNIGSSSGNLTPRPTALRKLRDRDRSESPMVDDDTTMHSDHSTTNHRSRRRYSSTPVIDSIPDSPASSDRDERDLRISKKSLLSLYSVLFSSRYSTTIQRILNEESSAQKLDEICLRHIDFLTIKKNIDSGLIRTVYELQRDILWMCQNALMITKSTSGAFKNILQFQQECQHIREFMSIGCEPNHKFERETRDNRSISSSTSGSTSKGRSGSRKSLRLS